MDRKSYLLLQVLKLFKQQKESHYVKDIERMTVIYDGAECDGSCLCDDIMCELGIYDLNYESFSIERQPLLYWLGN